MSDAPFDVIIVGTGAGGGTLLSRLARSGKRILVLERGGFLPREKENWDPRAVFEENRYFTKDPWRDRDGHAFSPEAGYHVGGNTKVYGAALFRLRERDFEESQYEGGVVSRRWVVGYDEFEPYYTEAEALYRVHGSAGDDPTEPWRSAAFPSPPVSDEPHIAELRRRMKRQGLHPFDIPLGILLDERRPAFSPCIRCSTCDGYPCLVNGKSDSDILCVRPALAEPNVTLRLHARVVRVLTSASGREATGVEVETDEGPRTFLANLVVLSAGAVNSAALLLRSASAQHPKGLANGSDQVGRNFMKHHSAALMQVARAKNPTVFQKTLAVNDFYAGDDGFRRPMGNVQLLGKLNGGALAAQAPAFAPAFALDAMARRSTDWWLTGEDFAEPDNRVRVDDDGIILEYTPRHTEGIERLQKRWEAALRALDPTSSIFPKALYLARTIPICGVAHQCGTCVFGDDPRTSVLDRDCRTHEVLGLYVVDASFFPSAGAVNPSLTIMANALRVGDRILNTLGVPSVPAALLQELRA